MVLADFMKAVVLTGHGGLEKLVIHDDLSVPKPKTNEVLIEVGACEHAEIRPVLAKKFPISKIKKAQEEFLNKKHLGNFIILPWQ